MFYSNNIHKATSKERVKDPSMFDFDENSSGFINLRECAVTNCTAEFSKSLPDKYQKMIDAYKGKSNFKEMEAKYQAEWDRELDSMKWYEKPVNGDASETAIVKFFQPYEDILEVRKRHKIGRQAESDASVPFNSGHKFALKVVTKPIEGSHWVVYLKGASERVWDKCSHVLIDGVDMPFTKEEQKKVVDGQIAFAKKGERILGFAKMHLPIDKYPPTHIFKFKGAYDLDIPMNQFVFLGLMSLVDPPREQVPGAIAKCKTAGIKVIMVTGDHQLTAASIAKDIGIFSKSVRNSIEICEEEGISMEEAQDKAEAIVVNGDMLFEAVKEDEGLPEAQKGKRLERWLKKK